ncbi:MAG: hypothetical protein IKD61_06815 [Oscillospiraceae bacterium]|nr:hypothetical protein [Oscillospiraceae bacterium]
MNIYDPYPEEIELDGRKIRLNMDFSRVLRVLDVQDMQDLTTADKIEAQCAMLLADGEALPRDRQRQTEIVNAAFSLIPKGEGKTAERFLDMHQDAKMIRSAFYRIGVDLTRDSLHINQFLELLADLPSDTALMRTVELRQRPIPEPTKHNAKERAALMQAKARVAIKASDEERRAQFVESLKNTQW